MSIPNVFAQTSNFELRISSFEYEIFEYGLSAILIRKTRLVIRNYLLRKEWIRNKQLNRRRAKYGNCLHRPLLLMLYFVCSLLAICFTAGRCEWRDPLGLSADTVIHILSAIARASNQRTSNERAGKRILNPFGHKKMVKARRQLSNTIILYYYKEQLH